MKNKPGSRSIYKLLSILLLSSLLFSSLSINGVTPARAQGAATGTPTPIPPSTPTPGGVQAQIVGGAPATPGEWPWHVALIDNAASTIFLGQFCSGSLIDTQWVLTAGHCITDNLGNVILPTDLDVIAGIYDLASPAAGYQRVHISQIIRHPAYNIVPDDSDIAMLKLATPITLGGSGATKTALVPLVPDSIGTLAGVNSEVTGWGNTISFGNVSGYPNQLFKVQLPIYDNSICNNGSHWGGGITGNMLCAGTDTGAQATCDGDSGGPLVVQDAAQWKLAGIVSFGSNTCITPNLPGVFTRVSNFGSWVNTQIGPATAIGPSGAQGTNYNPTYSWNPVANMTYYQLQVNVQGGAKVFSQWYTTAQANCTTTCSITPPNTLSGGSYTWWVQTWNPAGSGAWTAGMNFSLTIPPLPGKATLVSPTGNINNNFNPTYNWNQVTGSTQYQLTVNGPGGILFQQWYTSAQAACNGSTCSVTPAATLTGGTSYNWTILTWNSTGNGPLSDPMSFNTAAPVPPPAAILVTPTGSIGTNYNPAYTWNQVTASTWYFLSVDNSGGNILQQWYTSAQAACNGSTCSVTPATTLGGGAFTWKIETWSPAGTGPFSTPMSFSTTIPTLPGIATLTAPSGAIGTNHHPTYTWNQVAGATWYYLSVAGPTGSVLTQWYTSAQAACNGSTCSVTPSTTVPGGSYAFWVETWNSVGYGPWSAALPFSVSP